MNTAQQMRDHSIMLLVQQDVFARVILWRETFKEIAKDYGYTKETVKELFAQEWRRRYGGKAPRWAEADKMFYKMASKGYSECRGAMIDCMIDYFVNPLTIRGLGLQGGNA